MISEASKDDGGRHCFEFDVFDGDDDPWLLGVKSNLVVVHIDVGCAMLLLLMMIDVTGGVAKVMDKFSNHILTNRHSIANHPLPTHRYTCEHQCSLADIHQDCASRSMVGKRTGGPAATDARNTSASTSPNGDSVAGGG